MVVIYPKKENKISAKQQYIAAKLRQIKWAVYRAGQYDAKFLEIRDRLEQGAQTCLRAIVPSQIKKELENVLDDISHNELAYNSVTEIYSKEF